MGTMSKGGADRGRSRAGCRVYNVGHAVGHRRWHITHLDKSSAVNTSRRLDLTSTMSATSMAMSDPAPIAIPTSACRASVNHSAVSSSACAHTCASAGESLMPSPTMATTFPSRWRSRTWRALCAGSTCSAHVKCHAECGKPLGQRSITSSSGCGSSSRAPRRRYANLCHHVSDADDLRHCPRRRAVVSGAHPHFDAHFLSNRESAAGLATPCWPGTHLEGGDHGRRLLLGLVCNSDYAGDGAVHRDQKRRVALGFVLVHELVRVLRGARALSARFERAVRARGSRARPDRPRAGGTEPNSDAPRSPQRRVLSCTRGCRWPLARP